MRQKWPGFPPWALKNLKVSFIYLNPILLAISYLLSYFIFADKLPLSATVVDRRPKNVQQGLQRATLKRQPGVKSTSNLLHALENMGPKPKPIHEAPAELVSSGSNLSTPSYLKPTSASARKFRGVQAGTPNQNENHPKQTGAFPKKNR